MNLADNLQLGGNLFNRNANLMGRLALRVPNSGAASSTTSSGTAAPGNTSPAVGGTVGLPTDNGFSGAGNISPGTPNFGNNR